MTSSDTPAPVVVGIDGGPETHLVVRRAAELARALRTKLVLVHTFEMPSPAPLAYGLEAITPGRVRRVAHDVLDAALESMEPADREVVVSAEVLLGPPGSTLVRRSATSQLLVVGSRSRHGVLRGALTGSVADHCVRHAACSVLVVRSVTHSAAGDDADASPVPAAAH